MVAEIAASAQEQATGLGQVNTAVNQMDQVTQQNAAMVEESTAAAMSLKSEADELGNLVARFQIGDASGAGEARIRPADAARHTPQRNPVARVRAKLAAAFGRGGGVSAAEDNAGWEEF